MWSYHTRRSFRTAVTFLRDALQLPSVQLASGIKSNKATHSYGVVTAGWYDAGSAAADVFSTPCDQKRGITNFVRD